MDDEDCFLDFDDGDDGAEFEFECHGFMSDGRFYCPIAGTEECDWECGR